MTLINLTAEDTAHYNAFFARGLREHPTCFRISPADEASETFPTRATADSFTLGLLTDANELVGVVSFQREGQTRRKIRHKGLIFRMYVAADYSGQGLGRRLLTETIRRVREQTDIEQIILTVVSTNTGAKRLYESLGFRSFALEPNALKDGDMYLDEEQLVLFLTETP